MEYRVCQFCKQHADTDNLVKYGVRHYAHAVCAYKAKGEAWIAGLHRWQREQLPAMALVKAGLPLARLEALVAA